ncbi:hypothetical protein GOBAR_AA39564 [Gossypium barbadense]|uniref:RING-type domain-containing protein n=1 Tax=Gossypium barbadense TaxID=3634 RepID=A0A2P5VQM8_GOSBA|nr:hypothetical protein GOBAR_AA39564 [Gossypium barbadense]
MAFNYNVNIRQENETNVEEFSDNVFNIKIEFCYILSLNAEITVDIFNQTLIFDRDMFLSEQHHRDIILFMILNSGASPEFIEFAIFPSILSFARDANSNPMNLGLKVINMRWFRSPVEGLERVKWDSMTKREDECVICLDEFVKGEEVASMPCGHGYHDGCIMPTLIQL